MAEKTIQTQTEKGDLQKLEHTRNTEEYITPAVDIYEDEKGLVLLADLPGVNKDGLDIQVKDDILTIQAHADYKSVATPFYKEFDVQHFFRQFQLSEKVDAGKITAQFNNGVLKLSMPKSEETLPKKIPIEIG